MKVKIIKKQDKYVIKHKHFLIWLLSLNVYDNTNIEFDTLKKAKKYVKKTYKDKDFKSLIYKIK